MEIRDGYKMCRMSGDFQHQRCDFIGCFTQSMKATPELGIGTNTAFNCKWFLFNEYQIS